ncbi:MAG: hypothetical protein WAM14_17030 [Candidatus Nitrosopolaris sp.]
MIYILKNAQIIDPSIMLDSIIIARTVFAIPETLHHTIRFENFRYLYDNNIEAAIKVRVVIQGGKLYLWTKVDS